jgi:hypothetical protein
MKSVIDSLMKYQQSLYSTYYVPGTGLSTHLILTRILRERYYCLFYIEGETEAERTKELPHSYTPEKQQGWI